MKTCSKCGETKPTSDYRRDAQKRDGLQSCCRACDDAAASKYRAANRDKVRAYHAAYRAAHREELRAANAAYRKANPVPPEKNRIDAHNHRARKLEAGGKLSRGLAERLFKLQRGKCACGCGQKLGDDYHRDHIMPLALGGTNTDDNIQLLRATCNLQKSVKHPIDFMQQRGFLL